MGTSERTRRLVLRRERVRQLSHLSTDQMHRVVGGAWDDEDYPTGKLISRTCRDY
jgi:hypothetical protein